MKEMHGWVAVDRRTEKSLGVGSIHAKGRDARDDATEVVGEDWDECYRLGWRVVKVVIREAEPAVKPEPAQPAEAEP